MKKEDDGLTIYGVAEKDQGDYTCVASTELDKDSAKAYLTVLGKAVLPTYSCRAKCFIFNTTDWLQGQTERVICDHRIVLWSRDAQGDAGRAIVPLLQDSARTCCLISDSDNGTEFELKKTCIWDEKKEQLLHTAKNI